MPYAKHYPGSTSLGAISFSSLIGAAKSTAAALPADAAAIASIARDAATAVTSGQSIGPQQAAALAADAARGGMVMGGVVGLIAGGILVALLKK